MSITINHQPSTIPYKYLSIRNLLFFLAFLLTLSIIAYCKSSPTDTAGDSPTDTVEFDPTDTVEFDSTCTNGTASTEKVSVENTENCASCDTDTDYALTEVGDFMECRIPYICTNGDPIDGGAITVTENCASCDTEDYVLTKVGDFMECRIPYICTNGDPIDGGAITVTENCARCDTEDYVLTKVGDFMECRIPYICTNGDPIDGGAITVTENCARCNRHYRLESMRCVALDTDGDTILDINDVDADGDGLIEIHTLNDLATIRYDLDGSGSDDDSSKMRTLGDTGCGGSNGITACIGYELMQDLDFANSSSYATVNTDWLPDPSLLDNTSINFSSLAEASSKAGWMPIGSSGNGFSSTFEGNGFTISNLYVRRSRQIGFFGETTSSSKIRNIGLVDGAVFCGGGNDHLGGLVGYNHGRIIASSATGGNADGGGGNDFVGGLVGYNNGSIIASSATGGNADGGGGNDSVGGLVGYNNGSIRASSATGNADGGGDDDSVGGLVGYNNGSIRANYATGDAYGGGDDDSVGGLVGYNNGGIIASYATGNADGGSGVDRVGDLVGINDGGIIASYATGNAYGGVVRVGGLVGYNSGNSGTSITDSNSYSVMDAKLLTMNNFGTTWDFVWDFGTEMQPPALRYADYDGTGNSDDVEYCKLFLPLNIVCGTTLLPGQGR